MRMEKSFKKGRPGPALQGPYEKQASPFPASVLRAHALFEMRLSLQLCCSGIRPQGHHCTQAACRWLPSCSVFSAVLLSGAADPRRGQRPHSWSAPPSLGQAPGPRRRRGACPKEGPQGACAADLLGASGCAETVGRTRAGTLQTTKGTKLSGKVLPATGLPFPSLLEQVASTSLAKVKGHKLAFQGQRHPSHQHQGFHDLQKLELFGTAALPRSDSDRVMSFLF